MIFPDEMSAKSIDINGDLGESFGAYQLGLDTELMNYVSSANIACGWHAGDSVVMGKTVKMARDKGVAIGAHPGYPDLVGFGRRNMDCSVEEIRSYITYQVGALDAFCVTHSVRMRHVKPHGALYVRAMEDEKVGTAVCEAVATLNRDLSLFVLAGEQGDRLASIASSHGLKVYREGFPDRQYTSDGRLVSRRRSNALVSDPEVVAQRALMMAMDGKVISEDGSVIEMEVETLCVHGDNHSALELAQRIRHELEHEGAMIRALT